MQINYATTNQGKVESLRRDLEKYNIKVVPVPLDIPEPRSDDVKKIAIDKVSFAYNQIVKPVVALDAGFYIHSLNGFPKAYVNFALETVGIRGILKLAEGTDRKCEFRDCMAYLDEGRKEPRCFISDVKGRLAEEPRGTMGKHLWSQLSLIFIPEESDKTLAEMTKNEFTEWRKISREKTSCANHFGKWYSKQ